MKKLVALSLVIIMCFSLFSCGKIADLALERHAIALAAEKQETNYKDFHDEEYELFLEKIQRFSTKLTSEIAKKYGQNYNFAISPISVYMALALACECAEVVG